MTDREKLINLLREFGIEESQSYHQQDCFVVTKSITSYSDGSPCRYNDVSINSDGRLRRVEFLFNDDDSFRGLN